MILGLPLEYTAGFAVWNAILAVVFVVLLKRRRRWKKYRPTKVRWANLLLSGWLLLALLTVVEFYFAFVFDQSDSFSMTLVSERWFARHVEPYRNSDGFRDTHDFPRSLPEGVRHLCFFGDSFTLGHGVRRLEDRFSDQVAARFQRERPGRFLVSNAGENGYNISEVRGTITAFARQDRPLDVVVYVFVLNDIESFDPRTQEVLKPVSHDSPESWLFTQSYSWNWFYCRYRQFTRPQIANYFSYLRESYESPAWDKLAAELDGIAEVCKENRTDFRIVVFPFVHNLGPEYPFHEAHRKLREYCGGLGIRVLDLTDDLEPHAREGLTVNRFDAHPNEIAHRVAAQAMCDKLLDDLLVDDKSADQK